MRSKPVNGNVWKLVGVIASLLVIAQAQAAEIGSQWSSRNHFRCVLRVERGKGARSNSPVSVDLDFQQALAGQGTSGVFDENTVEVAPVEQANRGVTRVPHRVEKYFGITKVTLHFVMPDETRTNYAVYFDTVESGLGEPRRYHGLVGDGDRFCQSYGTREIAASHFDCFCDFDGDGDLDLFKGGVEPYVYCYENVGGNRFVESGRLTSGGKLFKLPCSKSNRSWVTVACTDVDGDGQQDFVPSFGDGPDAGRILLYKNVTRESGGQLTFKRVGVLQTTAGVPLAGGAQAGGWFPSITFVNNWDGDGFAALVGSNNRCWLYRGLGTNTDGSPRFAEPVAVQAGGSEIVLMNPRFDCVDIDGDGDLDLLAGTQPGPIYRFENIGTRTQAKFAAGKIIAFRGKYLIGDAHSGVKVADFDGDGLLDVVVGRFWQRCDLNQPHSSDRFGEFHKNVGTRTSPRFERWGNGAPVTQGFQICDAVRQNSVRAVDWNGDGKLDLLAGDTDGFIWFFRGDGDGVLSALAPGQKLRVGTEPLSVAASGGHARLDVVDWNNDGRKDLIVADCGGRVTLFLTEGKPGHPALSPGQPVLADGKPVQVAGRASVFVCDWNGDGRKDLLLADEKAYYVCKNIGSDANPTFATPTVITFNDKPVSYVRPNLGSFVDWDGDGKKDLIGCQFENAIRFYRNVAEAGAEPKFEDSDGIVLIQGESPQMISGADVVDWNGDGKLDIITGQGHGGSGLRFYARDWIEDELHNTHPVVKVLRWEKKSDTQ